MTFITSNTDLKNLCAHLASEKFVAVDTEFLREKTYYSKLCLLQISGPDKKAYAIDPLTQEEKLDLQPVWDLLVNPNVIKVFHAARQDLEIILTLSGQMVAPLFDTQVAAAVAGYGDQVGYDSLVQQICGHRADKSSQFTDWSKRPLSARQIEYALNDVIFLVDIYAHLEQKLKTLQRTHWVSEEMAYLTHPSTYDLSPDQAWHRLKIRSAKPKDLLLIQALAHFRETEAQRKDVPRSRILKDETLLDLAYQHPTTPNDLSRIRGISADMAQGRFGEKILAVFEEAIKTPAEKWPHLPPKNSLPNKYTASLEMLKLLLKIRAAEENVAARMIASSDDLEEFVLNPKANSPILSGWRYDIFGCYVEKLLSGHLALTLKDGHIQIIEV
jgi:ribonuclease D